MGTAHSTLTASLLLLVSVAGGCVAHHPPEVTVTREPVCYDEPRVDLICDCWPAATICHCDTSAHCACFGYSRAAYVSGRQINRQSRRFSRQVKKQSHRTGHQINRQSKRFSRQVKKEAHRTGHRVNRETKRTGRRVNREYRRTSKRVGKQFKRTGRDIKKFFKKLF